MDSIEYIESALGVGYESNLLIKILDRTHTGWASATATDVEWDAIALNYDSGCNHKWVVWPFDYKLLQCKFCGAEKTKC